MIVFRVIKKALKKLLAKKGLALKGAHSIVVDRRQLRTFSYLSHLYLKIERVPGTIVECGVGKGRTFLYLNFLAQQENKKRSIYGFDSFMGFPEPATEDASTRNPKKGEWAGMTPQDIKGVVLGAGFTEEWWQTFVHLVPGFFEDTVVGYDDGPIAFLHIDADLYSSYKIVLDTLFSRVSSGGIILFDEYNEEKWPGAKKAVDDFLKIYPHELIQEPLSGKYYIQKK